MHYIKIGLAGSSKRQIPNFYFTDLYLKMIITHDINLLTITLLFYIKKYVQLIHISLHTRVHIYVPPPLDIHLLGPFLPLFLKVEIRNVKYCNQNLYLDLWFFLIKGRDGRNL